MYPRFFKTAADFRKWLDENHESVQEQWVGYYKKDSGKPSISYPESVREALCFGWIDGLRKSIDADSYKIRFTPRRPKSIWSNVNIKYVEELKKLGLMKPAGLKAYSIRDPKRSGIYAFEREAMTLSEPLEKKFRANKAAWKFFEAQPTYYRTTCVYWIMNAKREETQQRRLERIIKCSAAGLRVGDDADADKK
jgi:uncharacterized protein YdeI (YjbR/CyaY-like superfamily)